MGRKREASVLISKMHRGRRHFAFQNTRILVEVKLRITMRAPNTLKQKIGPGFHDLPPKKESSVANACRMSPNLVTP